jgi:hypothetical protein
MGALPSVINAELLVAAAWMMAVTFVCSAALRSAEVVATLSAFW